MQKITFSAIIERQGNIDAAYIRFPFETKALFNTKGQVKVIAQFDNSIIYRGSLANMGQGCHVLGITKEIRQRLNKTFGDSVEVVIQQDVEPREVIIPKDLQAILSSLPDAEKNFLHLSYTHKKEYIQWIEEAKKPETRVKRLEKLVGMLMLPNPSSSNEG